MQSFSPVCVKLAELFPKWSLIGSRKGDLIYVSHSQLWRKVGQWGQGTGRWGRPMKFRKNAQKSRNIHFQRVPNVSPPPRDLKSKALIGSRKGDLIIKRFPGLEANGISKKSSEKKKYWWPGKGRPWNSEKMLKNQEIFTFKGFPKCHRPLA